MKTWHLGICPWCVTNVQTIILQRKAKILVEYPNPYSTFSHLLPTVTINKPKSLNLALTGRCWWYYWRFRVSLWFLIFCCHGEELSIYWARTWQEEDTDIDIKRCSMTTFFYLKHWQLILLTEFEEVTSQRLCIVLQRRTLKLTC